MTHTRYLVEIRPQGRESDAHASQTSFPALPLARLHAAHVLREWVSEELESINEALPVLSDDHLKMVGELCRAVSESIDLALALVQPDGPLEVLTAGNRYIAIHAVEPPLPGRRQSEREGLGVES